jgi:hypothetical protein
VIFECPLEDLVEEVRGEELIYIGAWEPSGEWLVKYQANLKRVATDTY